MLNSMTGFGSAEKIIASLGKASVELRSANHKYLDIAFHLPEGFLALEERIKKELESKVKRGRVVCAVNIGGKEAQKVFINKALLKSYLGALVVIRQQMGIKDGVSLETLVHLPGVMSLEQNKISKDNIWPQLKILLKQALERMVRTRQKEGAALARYLKNRNLGVKSNLAALKARFTKVIKRKAAAIKAEEERAAFLKSADISEEMERLAFHIRNFNSKLFKNGPVGKELDFVAQEMQREANTIAAKSCDVLISGRVVNIKSQIEKIREQVQNIE